MQDAAITTAAQIGGEMAEEHADLCDEAFARLVEMVGQRIAADMGRGELYGALCEAAWAARRRAIAATVH